MRTPSLMFLVFRMMFERTIRSITAVISVSFRLHSTGEAKSRPGPPPEEHDVEGFEEAFKNLGRCRTSFLFACWP